ncbi:MAG TPA: hypothetical protein VMB34_32570 [Acetobacteraceae bacterium]|nr:hypothetical protein [Acetobacteraceae bacterium]
MHLARRFLAIGAAWAAVPLALRAWSAPPAVAASNQTMRHRVVIQISEDDPKTMNVALNNAENLTDYYQSQGDQVRIEFVAYGPGLAMMRSDISPVKAKLEQLSGTMKNIAFSGCGNTLRKATISEGRKISLLPQAHVVPTGIVRIVQLQEQGWSYVRP